MRLAVIKSRLALVDLRGALDVEAASAGRFSPDPQGRLPAMGGQQMQKGRTGDLIFTGTPAGIGWVRDPKVVLRPGDRLVTHAEVIGEMTITFAAA
jgi:hypothetical protein